MILLTGQTSPRERPLIFTVIRAVGFQAALSAGFKTWVKNCFIIKDVTFQFYGSALLQSFFSVWVFQGGKTQIGFCSLRVLLNISV
ncbi:MAG: hypothetical protein D8M58_00005 [Calditrichaeota bacterium]|nr:MAG: hypothetical protein DWQ03_07075 [Calditrichota bacterium]MBL1203751.1 hypothetical protein [Calditrichota bacterium]